MKRNGAARNGACFYDGFGVLYNGNIVGLKHTWNAGINGACLQS